MTKVYADHGDDFLAGQAAGFIQGFGIGMFCPAYLTEYEAFIADMVKDLG